MKIPHPVIKSEIENIAAILTARGFSLPIVERGFSVKVKTYDLPNLMDLYYDNSLIPPPIYNIILSKNAPRIRKIISDDIQIVSINQDDTINNDSFKLKDPDLGEMSKPGFSLKTEIVTLIVDKYIQCSLLEHSFKLSWCAVLLDPVSTFTDYWWFILDWILLYLSRRYFYGYVLILCPEVNDWGTVMGWYRDFVFIKEGHYRILHGLSHEECYPWPYKKCQSEN